MANNNNNLAWQPIGNPNVDRWGLQASQNINDAWRQLRAGAALPAFSTVTQPIASAAWVNKQIVLHNPGSDDQLLWCRQLAGGGYEWKVVAY